MKSTYVSYPSIVLLFVAICFSSSFYSQEKEPQRIINTIPAKVPLKIEFINGGLKSAVDDIEIRVTNTGKKSIYFLELSISSEKDFQFRNGVGFSNFQIGNRGVSNFSRPFSSLEAERSETTPFEVGDTVILRVSKKEAELSWKLMMDYGYPKDSRLKLYMSLLRFEDGTGYMTPQAVEMPDPQRGSLSSPAKLQAIAVRSHVRN